MRGVLLWTSPPSLGGDTLGLGTPERLWGVGLGTLKKTLGFGIGHSRETLQGDSWVGRSKNTLELGIPGTLWGWALQR